MTSLVTHRWIMNCLPSMKITMNIRVSHTSMKPSIKIKWKCLSRSVWKTWYSSKKSNLENSRQNPKFTFTLAQRPSNISMKKVPMALVPSSTSMTAPKKIHMPLRTAKLLWIIIWKIVNIFGLKDCTVLVIYFVLAILFRF